MVRRARRPRASADAAPATDTDAEEAVLQDEGVLRLPVVERFVGMKKSTTHNQIRQSRLPEPVRNGERISSWREVEVHAWLRDPL